MSHYNLYDSKRHFSLKLSEALKRRGVDVLLLDLQKEEFSPQHLSQIMQFQPELTMSFNIHEPDAEGVYMWDFLKIPHLTMLVDPPIYTMNLTKGPYTILSCVDKKDVEYLRKNGFERAFFLPHAIEPEIRTSPSNEREYDIVFIGSCYDYERARKTWAKELKAPYQEVIESAIDLTFSSKDLSFTDAVVKVCKESSLDPDPKSLMDMCYFVDTYTRGIERIKLIESLQGLKIDIFGQACVQKFKARGWNELLKNQENITLHPSVDYPDSFEILKRAKISLNSMPFFKEGTHERIFASLLAGAAVVTTEIPFIKNEFGNDLLYFTYSKWGDIKEQVQHLLDNPEERKKRVSQGQKKVLKGHTWDQNADILMRELPPILDSVKRAALFSMIEEL